MYMDHDDLGSGSVHRPPLTPDLDPEAFRSRFWLLDELRSSCRQWGLPSSGSRAEVTARLERFLRERSAQIGPSAS